MSDFKLPTEVMIEILLRVESDNPIELRCVCKLWKSLIDDPHFIKNHLIRTNTEIFALLKEGLNQYHAFEIQYVRDNVAARQEDGPDEEEIRTVLNAFDEFERIWNDAWKLLDYEEEEEEKHWFMKQIAKFNHLLGPVRYLKENFNNMRDIMQSVEYKMRYHQNCLRIFLNSV